MEFRRESVQKNAWGAHKDRARPHLPAATEFSAPSRIAYSRQGHHTHTPSVGGLFSSAFFVFIFFSSCKRYYNTRAYCYRYVGRKTRYERVLYVRDAYCGVIVFNGVRAPFFFFFF